MSLTQGYIPPVNPDGRPLPSGWAQHYDHQRNLWIYLDMNVLPPIASLSHPAGFITNALPPTSQPPSHGDSNVRGGQTSAMSSASATQPPREGQEKTLAQQLYSSALSSKPKQPEASGNNARIPSPDYYMEDAAPAYSSTDPSSVSYATRGSPSASSGAGSSMASRSTSRISHPPSSGTSSGSRRPLPAPPPARDNSSSAAVPPPPFPEETKDLFQPTPLKAPNGHFHDGDRGNLADTLLHAIPELSPPAHQSSAVGDRRHDLGQQTGGLRSKPPSYSTATRPPTLRDRALAKPPPLPITEALIDAAQAPPNEHQSAREPQDDSDLIPPNSASTISPDPSPVYVSGVPQDSTNMSQSCASGPLLSPNHLPSTSPTTHESGNILSDNAPPSALPPFHDRKTPSIPEPDGTPFELPKRPPRNAFVPSQIMAIANRNMLASKEESLGTSSGDLSQAHASQISSPSVSSDPTQTERYSARGVALSAGDGLADPSSTGTVTLSLSPMVSRSSLSEHVNLVTSTSVGTPHGMTMHPPNQLEAPSGSTSSINLDLASGGAGPTKRQGMGSKFKKLGFGIGKAAGRGLAAMKRPSATTPSTSADAYGDGRADANSSNAGLYADKGLPMPPPQATFSVDHLPSLIEDVKIASPTLSAIPLPSDETKPRPRPQSLYTRTSSPLDYHRRSCSHDRPPPVPPLPYQTSSTSVAIPPVPAFQQADTGKKSESFSPEHRSIASLSRTNTNRSGSSDSRSIPSNESSHSSPHIPALRAIETYSSASSLPLQQPYSVYGDSGLSQKGRNAVNILASLGPQLGPDPPRKAMSAKAANLTARLGALGPQHPPLQTSRPSGSYSNHSTPSVSSTSNAANTATLMFGPPQWTYRSDSSR